MKKLLLTLFVLLIGIMAYCQNSGPLPEATGTELGLFTLSNKQISLDLSIQPKETFIKQITNVAKGTSFLSGNNGELWTIVIKKDKDYAGKEMSLTPAMAEKVFVDKTPTKITATWKNVKASGMNSGFDVTCTCEINGENSYWDAYISANPEYGIWSFTYPRVNNLNPVQGDQIFWPARGGRLYTEFDNPEGLEIIRPRGDVSHSKDIGFYTPGIMQVVSLIKGEASLYMCQEDPDSNEKTVNLTQIENNNFVYTPRLFAPHTGEANFDYRQAYPQNLAVVNGDCYNVMKKYRKWGLSCNYGVFANGRMEDRKDLPDWFKENNVWFHWNSEGEDNYKELLKSQDFIDMPAICHVYGHSEYYFDTHYPNWCPTRDYLIDQYKEVQAHNMHIMPYTNGHLVDINLSEYYKEYGDDMIALDEKGEVYFEPWSVDHGAKDVSACICGCYPEVYKGELKKLLKETNFDAIYMDQLGAVSFYPCFNELHKDKHTHAGNFWTKGYRKLISEVRKELSEESGKLIPTTTEDSADYNNFDGWLRINDGDPNLMPISSNMFVYSDYVVNFGVYNNQNEMINNDQVSAINKTAINLTQGFQLGWNVGNGGEFFKYPKYGAYFKSACKAREAFVKYFNFGEMVRPVKINSENPTMNLYYFWHSASDKDQGNIDFPTIRTCSFNYKGKTMLCFTNISDESIKVDFSCKATDLNLRDKAVYNINIAWSKDAKSNKKLKSTGKKGLVASNFTIDGRDIVMVVID